MAKVKEAEVIVYAIVLNLKFLLENSRKQKLPTNR